LPARREPVKPASSAPTDERLVAQLVERARKAAQARDRAAYLDCLTSSSRALFNKVFQDGPWEPGDLAGRKTVKVLEVRRQGSKPWAVVLVPGKGGQGQDALFARKEDGRWLLDQQHALLVWDHVQAIMRSQKGEKRRTVTLTAPNLLARQLSSSHLPEGWSAEDPAAENDWSGLPDVQEAFLQKLVGPREKNVKAKFVLFASPEDAEWQLWRRKTEFGLKAELADRQPSLGDGAALARHSSTNYELLLRKGSTLVILYANSEDVVPIGQRVVARF
jgi:hypothetical protein